MTKRASARGIHRNVSGILCAPRHIRVVDAVRDFMRVPISAGNSAKWDPNLTPYITEPTNSLVSREYDAVVFIGPARAGRMISLINGWIVYSIVCDPAGMLVIQVSEEKAREYSEKRSDRTFRYSPDVKSRLSPRRNDNSAHDRTFRVGNYLKIGWPSVSIMSSSNYKSVALTNCGRFPEGIGDENDAFSLDSKRTTTLMSSGMTLVESSSGCEIRDAKWRPTSAYGAPPTTETLSSFDKGDWRRLYWPCPCYGEYFQPGIADMTGFRETPDSVVTSESACLQCSTCKGKITPEMKRDLNIRHVWLCDGEEMDRDDKRYGEPR